MTTASAIDPLLQEGDSRATRGAWISGVLLAVLVFSGQVKETVLFAWLPLDLTLVTAVAVFVAIFVAWATQGGPSRRIVVPIAVWIVFLFPLLHAGAPQTAEFKIQMLFSVSLLIAVAPFFLLRTVAQQRGFLVASVGLGLLAAYVVATSGTTVAGFQSRFVLDGSDTIGTARLAAGAAIVCLLVGMARDSGRALRLVSVMAGVGLLVLALASGSRGPVLGAALAMLIVVLVARQFRRYRLRVVAVLLPGGVVAAAVAAVQSAEAYSRIATFVQGNEDASTAARDMLTAEAWRLLNSNPLGIGWGNFSFGGGSFAYPHNVYLEVAVEAGWAIGALFVGLIAAAGVRYLRVAPTRELLVFFGLFLFAAANAAVSSNLIGNRLLLVTAFAAFVPSVATTARANARPRSGLRPTRRSTGRPPE